MCGQSSNKMIGNRQNGNKNKKFAKFFWNRGFGFSSLIYIREK